MTKEKPPETEGAVPLESPKTKRSIKKVLIIALVGLVLIGGGLAAYVMLTDEPQMGKGAQAGQVTPKPGVTMALEPFLVNLADKESRRYLKLKVELEVDNEASAKELEKSLPRIRDALILLLSSKTYLDLASFEGKQQLKQDIKNRIAALPGGQKVSDVFFTEFVAQ
jgi:flagellar FliL protein|uniref:Flagellar protein FliL n=1 Tax=Desulfobacca acetoxidans TaxID=60893 RepID=A0A7C3Z7Z4_9BACT